MERIVRLQEIQNEGGLGMGPSIGYSHSVSVSRYRPETTLENSSFLVYTAEQYDAARAADQSTVAALKDIVTLLGKNVKDLSDMNDALVKRLDELDERVAAGK